MRYNDVKSELLDFFGSDMGYVIRRSIVKPHNGNKDDFDDDYDNDYVKPHNYNDFIYDPEKDYYYDYSKMYDAEYDSLSNNDAFMDSYYEEFGGDYDIESFSEFVAPTIKERIYNKAGLFALPIDGNFFICTKNLCLYDKNGLSRSVITDEEKIEIVHVLEGLDMNDVIIDIIANLASIEKRIDFLKNMEGNRAKAAIIENIVSNASLDLLSDEKMIELLTYIRAVSPTITNYITDSSSVDKIMGLLHDQRAINLLTDEKIKEVLNDIKEEHIKFGIVLSLESDEKKAELLNYIKDDYAKAKIVASFESDEKKVELLNYIKDDYAKAVIVSSLKNDEEKLKYDFRSIKAIGEIVASLGKYPTQAELELEKIEGIISEIGATEDYSFSREELSEKGIDVLEKLLRQISGDSDKLNEYLANTDLELLSKKHSLENEIKSKELFARERINELIKGVILEQRHKIEELLKQREEISKEFLYNFTEIDNESYIDHIFDLYDLSDLIRVADNDWLWENEGLVLSDEYRMWGLSYSSDEAFFRKEYSDRYDKINIDLENLSYAELRNVFDESESMINGLTYEIDGKSRIINIRQDKVMKIKEAVQIKKSNLISLIKEKRDDLGRLQNENQERTNKILGFLGAEDFEDESGYSLAETFACYDLNEIDVDCKYNGFGISRPDGYLDEGDASIEEAYRLYKRSEKLYNSFEDYLSQRSNDKKYKKMPLARSALSRVQEKRNAKISKEQNEAQITMLMEKELENLSVKALSSILEKIEGKISELEVDTKQRNDVMRKVCEQEIKRKLIEQILSKQVEYKGSIEKIQMAIGQNSKPQHPGD